MARRCASAQKERQGRYPPGRFGKDSVREILQHPFYTGKVPYYGRDDKNRKRKRNDPAALYEGLHPALVSDELFQRAKELRAIAGTRTRTNQGVPRVYTLSGLLACWHCRRKMRVNTSNGHRYYNDSTSIERLGHCDQPAVPAKEIEGQVIDFVRSIQLPADWQERVDELLFSARELTDVRQEEMRMETRLDRATELYLEGTIDKERLQQEQRNCERQLANLYPPQKSGMIQAGLYLEQFDQLWSQAKAPGQKNRLLRRAVIVAFASGLELAAIQLGKPFYALMQFWRCGSDGNRSTCKTRVDLIPPSWNPAT